MANPKSRRLGVLAEARIKALAAKLETSEAEVLRIAVRKFAESEGVKLDGTPKAL